MTPTTDHPATAVLSGTDVNTGAVMDTLTASRARPSVDVTIPHGQVYHRVAQSLLPRWMRILGGRSVLGGLGGPCSVPRNGPAVLLRQQAAALGVGLVLDHDPPRSEGARLKESVRSALVRWQLSMRGDGCPVTAALRGSPLTAVIAGDVVHLLSETRGFQTSALLNDLANHLHWVARRSAMTPWAEAAAVGALSDGALLVRDRSLVSIARERLARLLVRQDDEGWFPESGGADIGRLALTIDALARVYRQSGWDELRGPLARATKFLTHFVHPDDTAGGTYGSCGTAFMSPAGLELLAASNDDAAWLAAASRRNCERLDPARLLCWDDDLCSLLGSRIAQAAVNAPATLPHHAAPDAIAEAYRFFPSAGLVVYRNDSYFAAASIRRGGALCVIWDGNRGRLDDAGVSVVHGKSSFTSNRQDARTQGDVTPSSLRCHGVLRRAVRGRVGLRKRIRRWLRGRRPAAVDGATARSGRSGNALRDLFERDITFESDGIVIRDSVRCRRRADALLTHAALTSTSSPSGEGSADPQHRYQPGVDGSHHIEVVRVYRDGRLISRQG
ncbi:MAG: hypothetical protein IIB59_01480 [Planctomycetes bacterium]|nr:hypothetical protein [Planctomycetota bacterium]